MATQGWTERFFETTRGRIVRLLRRSKYTVSELAEELGLTANAVRGHLAVLERDGIIERAGLRRGLGKPAHLYRLTREAEQGMSRAYAPVLGSVLGALDERLDGEEVDGVLELAGRIAAAHAGKPRGSLDDRIRATVDLLEYLGGDIDVERSDGRIRLRGHGCPLSAMNGQQAKTCRVVQALLEELVGLPARECCDRGSRPDCIFEFEPEEGGD